MKNVFGSSLKIIIGISLAVAPLAAAAQSMGAAATTTASTTASTTRQKPPLPKLGPQIKNTLEQTRPPYPTASTTGSTTRSIIKMRVEAVHDLIDEHKDEVRERLMQNKESLKERVDAVKEKAREKWNEAAQRSVNNIIEKLNNAVDRLENIAGRAEEKITELQAEGYPMTNSLTLLTEAQADIGDAQVKVDAVGAALEAALAIETPKEKISAIRSAVKAAEQALRTAKASLHEVLVSIRAEGPHIKTSVGTSGEGSTDTSIEIGATTTTE